MVAVELDPALVSALNDVLEGRPRVRVVPADAMRLDWDTVLGPGDDPWILCANLPYNIATPLVLDVLARVPRVVRSVVMMQREVGERLAARPGDDAYGAVSVRVAYRATASTLRRVPPEVFWPRPKVESVVVRLDRLGRGVSLRLGRARGRDLRRARCFGFGGGSGRARRFGLRRGSGSARRFGLRRG